MAAGKERHGDGIAREERAGLNGSCSLRYVLLVCEMSKAQGSEAAGGGSNLAGLNDEQQ